MTKLDLTEFTEFAGEATTAVGIVGASVVGIYGLTLAWPFIMGWMGKARRAGNGKAGS